MISFAQFRWNWLPWVQRHACMVILATVVSTMSGMELAAYGEPLETQCATSAIERARREARVLASQDPTAAWQQLRYFVQTGCVNHLPAHPGSDELRMAQAYAWLLNDAFVYFTDPRYSGSESNAFPGSETTDHPDCYAIIFPILDDQLHPRDWLTPSLKRAATTNVKACARHCVSMMCTPLNSQVWETYQSEEHRFTDRPCKFAPGQQVDANNCVEPKAGAAGSGFDWTILLAKDAHPEGPTAADMHRYCGRLLMHARSADGRINTSQIDLPPQSATNDAARCCADFSVRVMPDTPQLMLSGGARNCDGGTAEYLIEEIYQFNTKTGHVTLVRDNSETIH